MSVTRETFLESFPEFEDIACKHRDLFDAKLAEAALLVDGEVWGDQEELGCKYLAAHLLAISPCGRSAGLTDPKKPNETSYGNMFDMWKRAVSSGCRVI